MSFNDAHEIFIKSRPHIQQPFSACYNQNCLNEYQNYCFECSIQLLALFALLYYLCELRRL
jgi:hypothetical protein